MDGSVKEGQQLVPLISCWHGTTNLGAEARVTRVLVLAYHAHCYSPSNRSRGEAQDKLPLLQHARVQRNLTESVTRDRMRHGEDLLLLGKKEKRPPKVSWNRKHCIWGCATLEWSVSWDGGREGAVTAEKPQIHTFFVEFSENPFNWCSFPTYLYIQFQRL